MQASLSSTLPRLTNLLAQITTTVPISAVLEDVALLVEREIPGVRCTLALANHMAEILEHGAAPSMPAEYASAVNGIRIAEGQGGCGTAAARRWHVIVPDIENSPLWSGFLRLARRHSLRACWSIPFFGDDGRVSGTLAAYASVPREPTVDELEFLKYAALLAGLVVTRHRDARRIRESAEHYRQLAALSPDGVIVHQDGRVLYVNAAGLRLLDLDPGTSVRDRPLRSIIPQQSATALQQIGTGKVGVRWRRRDGGLVIIEALSVPVTFDDQHANLVVCRDISDRIALEREILRSTERDRARLALELHEGVGQQLAGISLMLVSARDCIATDPQRAKADLDNITRLVTNSVARVRLLAGLSYPIAVEHDRLSLALNELAQRARDAAETRIEFSFEPGADQGLDHAVATELYRIAQEALGSAMRHPSVRTIQMALARDANEITLSIIDDGVGTLDEEYSPGSALSALRHQAGLIGATTMISPRQPVGTRVEVRLPVADALVGAAGA